VEELGIPELTSTQIEQLSVIAEQAARKHILTKVPAKKVENLDITVETEGTKPVKLTINIDIALSPSMKNLEIQKLVDESVKKAFAAAEGYLRELKCSSQK
jgi:hypothetical protein